jgi:hypothetical protein
MTEPHQIQPSDIDPSTLSLAQLLTAHPRARRGLELSIERQRQQRAQASRPAASMACPHCGAPGIVYLTLPTSSGPRPFLRRPMDCCQPALRDAAENALRYAMNPNNDAVERIEHAERYAALRECLTDPVLIRELEGHEALLADIESRVSGLARPQGGVEL